MDELREVAERRLRFGSTAWLDDQRDAVVDLLEQLRPLDGGELDQLLARVAIRLDDPELIARMGLELVRNGETFAPLVSYLDSIPATPSASARVRVVADIAGSDLQVGRLQVTWPGGTFLGLPDSAQQIGTLTLDLDLPGVGPATVAILTDGQDRAFVDSNSSGAIDAADHEIVIGPSNLEITFPAGGEGLPEITSLPGTPRGRLTVDMNSGLYLNPGQAFPLGAPVAYSLRAVSAETGLAADGTLEVSGTVPATIADLVGRLYARPAVVGTGEAPSLFAQLANTGATADTDLYLAIQKPSGTFFTLDASLNWIAGIAPLLADFSVPAGLSVESVPLPAANVFDQPGDYRLYFAALEAGTFDFISLTTTFIRVE